FPKPEGEIAIPFGSGDTVDFDGIVKSVMPYARNIIRTAKNLKRVMTAEVKGNSGALTAYVGAGAGATASLIPEKDIDCDHLIDRVADFYNAKRLNSSEKNEYGLVLVSENAFIDAAKGKNKEWLEKAFKANPVVKAAYDGSAKSRKIRKIGSLLNAILKVGLSEKYGIKDTTEAGKIDYGHVVLSQKDEKLIDIPFDYKGIHRDIWEQANLAEGMADTSMDTIALLEKASKFSGDISRKIAVEPDYLDNIKMINGYMPALVIGANAVFENGATLEAIAQIKEHVNLQVTFWSDSATDIDKLKALGADRVADGYSASGLKDALAKVMALSIPQNRIAVINSSIDFEKVRKEYKVDYIDDFQFQNPDLEAILLKMPQQIMSAGINAMPLVFSRAISSIVFNDEALGEDIQERARSGYNTFVSKYEKQVDEATLEKLKDLSVQLEYMPTLKVSEEIVMLANSYEQTVNKI
ncbi:MAG: 6-phosphofructokinase, partial [Candidatus Omnitrophota bacterium]